MSIELDDTALDISYTQTTVSKHQTSLCALSSKSTVDPDKFVGMK